MTWNLFIDDERDPRQVTWGSTAFYHVYPWTIARSLSEVQELVQMYGFPEFISFDHDLGTDQPTGKDIANWLIEQDMDYSTMPSNFSFYVHSRNPVGKANIESLLNNYLEQRNVRPN